MVVPNWAWFVVVLLLILILLVVTGRLHLAAMPRELAGFGGGSILVPLLG
jgi:hypothetical protein